MTGKITKLSFVLIIVALLLCLLPTIGLAAQSGAYTYTVSNGKATIIKYTGSATAVTIPSKLGGYPVVAIGDNAFEERDNLENIAIPSGVARIGKAAFKNCGNLENATIPGNVTSIGEEAFFRCVKLRSITIPGSVTSIGVKAFASCDWLAAINVDASSQKYSSQDGVLFNKTKTELIQCPPWRSITTYTIPNGVISIGKAAFYGCENRLTGVAIPGSVISIGDEAFYGCALSSITIPSSVTRIGTEAFSHCEELTSVAIPASVTYICTKAFTACRALSAIHVNTANQMFSSQDGVLFNKMKTGLIQFPCAGAGTYTVPVGVTNIGESAFSYCNLTRVTVPGSVTRIEKGAFLSSDSLTGVTITKGVTTIGNEAFANCDSLGSVTLPSSVTSMGAEAFSDCDSLTSIMVPGSVASIGDRAFADCDSLTRVTISNGVTGIGKSAFSDCRNLTKVTIPGSVNSIGERAFDYCGNLTSVTIANGVTDIGKGAFGSCWSLPSIAIPVSIDSIGESAFSACRSLTSFTVPSGVVSIGRWAFASCWKLTSVTISDTVTSIGKEAFAYSDKLTAIHVNAANPKYSSQDGVLFNKARTELVQFPAGHAKTAYTIPSGVTTIGPWAFGDSRSLASVTFPESVASIKQEAFVYCGKLKNAFFLGNAPATDKFVFDCGSDFTVYYRKDKAGFTNPWHGYPTATYILPAATAVKAVMATQTSARLTWGAVAGVAKYEVYRATSGGGLWTKLTETASTTYTNNGLATGTAYYYKVRAYGLVDTVKVYGDYSAVVSPSAPATPANVKAASSSYNSVKLTWGAVTGASGYVVYRSASSNGTYTLAAVLPSGSTAIYTNAGLTAGKTYYYKLRAYRTVGVTKVYGDYSAVASARPIPALPTGVKAARASATSIKLTWGAVTGASGYVVYRATSSTGAYTLVAVLPSGSTASYINNGLTTGKTYYYKLRAYRTVGTTKVYGGYSAVVSAKP